MNNTVQIKPQRDGSYDGNPELIRRFRAGDAEAGSILVELNQPLIYSIAARFRDRGADMSDILEGGKIFTPYCENLDKVL